MESGHIPDSALTASSAYEVTHVGPQFARLRNDTAGGAWCPHSPVGPANTTEWIQVNLGQTVVVTGIATQGRYGGGRGIEFTDAYRILYSRQRIPTKWIVWKSWNGRSKLDGNIDPNTVEEHQLKLPIVGVRHIRLVPLSNQNTRTVCLRFELYGCSYQGPISYRSPGPVNAIDDSRLWDSSYDGSTESAIHFDGLGKLIDGVKPSQGETISDPTNDWRWVGWPPHNHSESSIVKLEFEFDQIVNFTTVSLNCQNSYSRNVRVFSTALVWFSLDRQSWSQSPIRFVYEADNVIQLPRDVIIHLQYRIGRFIRIELTYHSSWLQLSEVSFDVRPLQDNLSLSQIEDLFERLNSFQYNQANDDAATGGTRYIMPEENSLHNQSGKGGKSFFPVQDASNPTVKYSLIIVCLCTFGLVIISLLTLLAMKKLNNRKSNVFREISETDLESESATINLKNLPKDASPLYCEPKEISSVQQEEAEYAIPDVICPSSLSKTLNFHKASATTATTPIVGNVGKMLQINPRFYASSDIICPKQNIYGTRPGTQILNVFDIAANVRTLNPNPKQHPTYNSGSQQQTPLLDTFGGGGVVHRQSGTMGHNVRTSFYGDTSSHINGTFGVRAYSEAEVGVLQSLGKSKFGDVLLCNIPTVGKNRLAVVRTVNDLSLKSEFTASMQFMRQLSLKCDKFARLFGVIETPNYFASIIEHADCDLNYFLRKSSPQHISFETLLYIAGEIANAGAYLESTKQTHRDIAARNVIVYEKNLSIKLTDVAMFEDKYAIDYYNGLPIRWMSPESIVRTQFTIQSDVYAFGVCFWEILMLCQCRPFADMSDDDFITAVYASMEDDDNFLRLPRPAHCSNEIYDLLDECCNINEDQRPTFKEICLFLQRKTLGYSKSMNTLIH
ncbi:DNA damage responsive protein [Blomia tropicalis]|nr:DNA damage responsive protein [Blomia tropicalis]